MSLQSSERMAPLDRMTQLMLSVGVKSAVPSRFLKSSSWVLFSSVMVIKLLRRVNDSWTHSFSPGTVLYGLA